MLGGRGNFIESFDKAIGIRGKLRNDAIHKRLSGGIRRVDGALLRFDERVELLDLRRMLLRFLLMY